MRSGLAAILALALVTLAAPSCTTWRATTTPPQQLVADKPEIQMKVFLAGAPEVVLSGVTVFGDTLRGYSPVQPESLEVVPTPRGLRVDIPLRRIQWIEVRRVDAVKTTLLIVGIGVTVAVIVAAIALASEDDDDDPIVQPGDDFGSGFWSCPLLFSRDGDAWRLDSGTYAGAIMPALARSDVDNLEHAREEDGTVRLLLTGLPGETEHVDELALLAVDHDSGVSVAPDGAGRLTTLGPLHSPRRAADFAGRDALQRLETRDEWCWESALSHREATTEGGIRDGLELEFARPDGARQAKLVVDGAHTPWTMLLMREVVAMHGRDVQAWYDQVAADSSRVRRMRETMGREGPLHVRVWTGDRWEYQGSIPSVGPECPKRQVLALDLSRVRGTHVRVRLECVPNLWLVDCASIDYSAQPPVLPVECTIARARTRAGVDVRGLLEAKDGVEYVISRGDSAEVAFHVPPVPKGMSRTYLARTTGWYRIHVPEVGEPRTVLLERLETEPRAFARYAVERMNRVVSALAIESR